MFPYCMASSFSCTHTVLAEKKKEKENNTYNRAPERPQMTGENNELGPHQWQGEQNQSNISNWSLQVQYNICSAAIITSVKEAKCFSFCRNVKLNHIWHFEFLQLSQHGWAQTIFN